MNLPALPQTVSDMVDEYDEKVAAVDAEIAAFKAATDRLKNAACVAGVYAGSVMEYAGRSIYDAPVVSADTMKRLLLASGWKAIYKRLNIETIATANDKKLFERTLADPPPLTKENALATFGRYVVNPRIHILRGLAEAFSSLDLAYKSHTKVKIGAKALPKRIILSGFGEYSYGSYGRDKFTDCMNALAAYRGQPLFDGAEYNAMERAWRAGGDAVLDGTKPITAYRNGRDETYIPPNRGVWVRRFQNGNIHLFFDTDALTDINKALAEFYGDVLPDAEPSNAEKRPGTAVAKDLQFYPTPLAVIDRLMGEAGLTPPKHEWDRERFRPIKVLEPSCGDGRILDALKAAGHRALGVEVDPGRADQARRKGHAVVTANFLDEPATPE